MRFAPLDRRQLADMLDLVRIQFGRRGQIDFEHRYIAESLAIEDAANERGVIIGKVGYLVSVVCVAGGPRLKNGAILSLGSFLTENLSGERCVIMAGIPARPTGQLDDYDADDRIERHGAIR